MKKNIYKANGFELPASAYEWLGSVSTNAKGAFSFLINNQLVEAVSLTASNILAPATSNIIKYHLVTSVNEAEKIPAEFSLEQNYPNPFNTSTKIKFSIPDLGTGLALYVLKVCDVLGNETATLINEGKSAGNYEVEFIVSQVSRAELPSGAYFYKLQAGSFTETKKMILIR